MINLTRYFSLTSLVGLLVLSAILLGFSNYLTKELLVHHEARSNENVTQAFANSIWQRHRGFVLQADDIGRDALLASDFSRDFRSDVLVLMDGLSIAKVKLYSRRGVTLFSFDQSQVGSDQGQDSGVRSAINGETVSGLTFKDKFRNHEGVHMDVNLVYSYVPLKAPNGDVEAVLEVYSDVTHLINMHVGMNWIIMAILLVSLGCLYLFQLLIVRRADSLLKAHIGERKQVEMKLQHIAFHDELTELPNRANFHACLAGAIESFEQDGQGFELVLMDLDRFKVVNDSLGHSAGDLLLRKAAERLRDCAGDEAKVFRMGGDEFTILVPAMQGESAAGKIAESIIKAFSDPLVIDDRTITIGISIGISRFPDDARSAKQLIKNADTAMYQSKFKGPGNCMHFVARMQRRNGDRLELENRLTRAVRDGEFVLHYQPRVSADTEQIIGIEALLRWQDPEHGLMQPLDFIPSLEETGLIVPVGNWVIEEACRQNQQWVRQGLAPVKVSVNISARQIRGSDLEIQVKHALYESGLRPELLELELTESTLMDDPQAVQSMLCGLKAIGVSISIDDFGTGYSSLGRLKDMPIDYLKIDRSFVKDIGSNDQDAAIASAITELSRRLGIKVVAEGVETRQQVDFLRNIDCDEFQGYFFSKPVASQEMGQLLFGQEKALRAVS